jgi:hypothetical protein
MRSNFFPFPLSKYYDGMAAGLKTVILLSFVLAVGFLMIILSCALYSNWLPLIVGGFKSSPLPSPHLRLPPLLPADYNSDSVDLCPRPTPQRTLLTLRR